MKRCATASLVLLASLAVLTGACTAERTVRIGAVLPLSGPWAIYGEPIRKGIELAHEQLLAEYEAGEFPHRIELWVKDSESQPIRAAEAFQELIDEHDVDGVIGGVTSAEALVMIDVAAEQERVLLSPSASSPDLTEQKPTRYFYRIYPSDFREGTQLASWTALNLPVENAVVVSVNTPFARGISRVFENEFERYDGEVLDEIVYPEGQEDFSDIARQVKAKDPQAVYLADFAEQVKRIIQALDRVGFKGYILTTSAFAAPDVIAEAGKLAEGVVLAQTVFDPDSDDPTVQKFVEAYREKYDETPGLFAAHGYDAMRIMAQASLAEASGVPSEFWKGMRSLGDYQGVTGSITFDQKGDVGKFPHVYVVKGGKLVDYDDVLEEKKREIQERRQQLFQQLERLRKQQRDAREGQG
jgi:branched-chain amino acid transport system substrate-binding protein